MKIEDVSKHIDKIIAELENTIKKEIEVMALDAIQTIETRIVETGLNDKGAKFAPYDKNYAEYKQSKGYVTDHVTLKLTGDMWASIGILERKNSKGKYEVVVGFRDQFSLQKAVGNSKKRDFMKLSKEEQKQIADDFKTRLKLILKKL